MEKEEKEAEGVNRGEWGQEISCVTGCGTRSGDGTSLLTLDKTDSLRHLPHTHSSHKALARGSKGQDRGTTEIYPRIAVLFHYCQIFTKSQASTLLPERQTSIYLTHPSCLKTSVGNGPRIPNAHLLPLPLEVPPPTQPVPHPTHSRSSF